MNRTTRRAGAFGALAMLLATIIGVTASGAVAQNQIIAEGAADIQQPDFTETPENDGPRFVAHEVVQPLPDPAEDTPDLDADSLRELVTSFPASESLSRDLHCLATAIYFEARGEPLEGQLAVGRVIINRAESHRFPDDYCGVVTQRAQFSFVKNGRIPSANERSKAWKRAKAIAHIAHDELWASPADDALYFHATHVAPRWARTRLAAATIDRHIFYK